MRTGCQTRFLQIQAYLVACDELACARFDGLDETQIEAQMDQIEDELVAHRKRLAEVFNLPADVELPPEEPLPEERFESWIDGFDEWCAGTLGEEGTDELIYDLEVYLEVDYLYVLLGLPNYAVSDKQRVLLGKALRAIGSWFVLEDPGVLESICLALRSESNDDD